MPKEPWFSEEDDSYNPDEPESEPDDESPSETDSEQAVAKGLFL